MSEINKEVIEKEDRRMTWDMYWCDGDHWIAIERNKYDKRPIPVVIRCPICDAPAAHSTILKLDKKVDKSYISKEEQE